MRYLENEPLAPYTSWRIGGPARYFVQATGAADLASALAWAEQRNLPVFILGGGSNILVRDSGFDGLVIRIRGHEVRLEANGDTASVIVEAGAPMAGTARRLARQGWSGLEWAEAVSYTHL
ncbi:MAG: FAD-binding protein, partial [Roseiflexus sp.]|nr:FAD-binding protein [Roseiflexus sp.]